MKYIKKYESFSTESVNENLKSVLAGVLLSLSTLAHADDNLFTPQNIYTPGTLANTVIDPYDLYKNKDDNEKPLFEYEEDRNKILQALSKMDLKDSILIKLKGELSVDVEDINIKQVTQDLINYCNKNNFKDLSKILSGANIVIDQSNVKTVDVAEKKVHLLEIIKSLHEMESNIDANNNILLGAIAFCILLVLSIIMYRITH